ncbi:iron dicitrate transport regulator FecR [Chitinophaga alhagiae]|uniref:Iron dicitrate transport regulator FecR n=1 Tax=Chitinophaga alhagiae TaxID=2203219 RepID=A0ABM6WD66_9BACT|nr:FecR family protein [Chitinophaga alhagiae]AWO01982.1 iron dicitrate transport regulator FecR [Chitinophaga alhagiae]
MSNERLTYLFFRYFGKTASREELDELALLASRPENAEAVKRLMEEAYNTFEPGEKVFTDTQSETLLSNIQSAVAPAKRRSLWPRIATAAAAAMLLLIAGWWALKKPQPAMTSGTQQMESIRPGSNKATLVLADGSVVTLDSAGNQVIRQGNTVINQRNGQLLYTAGNGNAAVTYNTLSTPRGGQFVITLPDGSKAWLNAASSIRFPTAFTGGERKVEMTGEAYFEIAKDAHRPFRVAVNDMTIEVLGTHFNVNAYMDENILAATLLEGAVRLTKGTESVSIRPGEQAQWKTGSNAFSIAHPELDRVMAWKNGYFRFSADNITDIMKQLARWYDIEPVYAGNMTMKDYDGYISRASDISEVLKMLELTEEVSFKIEGRKVTVTAK